MLLRMADFICYIEKSDTLSIEAWEILPTPLAETRQQSVGIVARNCAVL